MKFHVLAVFFFLSHYFPAQDFRSKIQKQIISFTENKGQISDQFHKPRPDVLFSGETNGMVFHLRNNGISYQLNRIDSWKKDLDQKNQKVPNQSTLYRLDINWLGINKNYTTITEKESEGYNNYYLKVCPNGITNVKTFAGVFYNNIYHKIDLHYFQKNNTLKYDYIVLPGGDYKQIQLQVNGANKIIKQKDGSLIFTTPLGVIQEGNPIVYQNNKKLKTKWVLKDNILSFDIENYDAKSTLLIDPAIRVWGTYYGGTDNELAVSSTADISGNVFISGYTQSSNGTSIASTGAYQTSWAGSYDAFIAKFNSGGARLWGTYYGGSGDDYCRSCNTDIFGNIYSAGYTDSNVGIVTFTATAHQAVKSSGSSNDAYLAKFNSNGLMQWSTYYGGNTNDYGYACATDDIGNVYLSGVTGTSSGTTIATIGSHQPTLGGAGDAFLVKFNSSGQRQWGTYYGGLVSDFANSCITDATGNVYLAGYTNDNTNSNIIATLSSHQATNGGGNDAFLVKFNSSGQRQWGTYYGGLGDEVGYSCATDLNKNVFLTGQTNTSNNNMMTTLGSHQPTYGGGSNDAFLVLFDSTGTRQWATYYGGSGQDRAYFCKTDLSGSIYIVGDSDTNTGTAIATSGSHQPNLGGGSDGFLVKLDPNCQRQFGTYYGGTCSDCIYGCTIGTNNSFYFTGFTCTYTGTAIATLGSFQPSYGGLTLDAFLVKFECPVLAPLATVNNTMCEGAAISFTGSYTNTLTVDYFWNGPNGFMSSVLNPLINNSNLNNSGIYTLTVNDGMGCAEYAYATVTVQPNPLITVNSGSVCLGQSFTINPSGAFTYTFSSGTSIISPTITSFYTVTGTSAVGCISANPAISNVIVNPTPTITVNSGSTCAGQNFIIIPNGALTYTYSGGSNTVSPIASASYSVNGTDANGCVNTTPAISNVAVNSLPPVNTITSASIICTGQSATITANGANTYSWNTTSTNISIVISPTVNTTYTVTGTDVNGCNNFATITQSVSLCTGISVLTGLEKNPVKIYPNPTTSFFNVEIQNYNSVSVEVYNSIGQLVLSKSIADNLTRIDLSAFANGLYIIKVRNENEVISFSKFVKNN